VPRPRRRAAWQWTTLLLSVALAVTLGAVIYLATTSLPYLASAPGGDPIFGDLNACLLEQVPSRTGFAVSRDASQAAAWSTSHVAVCVKRASAVTSRRHAVGGVTVGAFDGAGALWVVSQPGGLTSTLLRLGEGGPVEHGETGAVDVSGTGPGLVVLEQSGRLVALSGDGAVTAVAQVKPARGQRLSTSADGALVAVTGASLIEVFSTERLSQVRREAPCEVNGFWWLTGNHRAVVTCGPQDAFALIIDVDTGTQEPAAPGRRAITTLAGAAGPWVQPCDLLPCTGASPEQAAR
jgi:hypothetical protein